MAAKKRTARKPPDAKRAAARRKDSRPNGRTAAGRRASSSAPDTRTERLHLRDVVPGFTVSDVHKSLAWYCNVLGCKVKARWERGGQLHGAELGAGNATFYIGQDDLKKGRERRKGDGLRLYCSTAQDVDALAAAIRERGGVLEYGPNERPSGGRDFGLVDPDGFKITIGSR